MPRDEQILNRAYKIWEKNGKPEGREQQFWNQAMSELKEEEVSQFATARFDTPSSGTREQR